MALSGCVLLFKEHLRELAQPHVVGIASLDAATKGRVVDRAAQRYGASLRYVRFPDGEDAPIEALRQEGGAYLGKDGEVLQSWSGTRPLDWLTEFHHRLLLDKTGASIIGIVGLVALGLVLSGLWLWWPLRARFTPKPFPSRNSRPALLAVHRNLGAMLSPVLLVIASTGALMALPDISQPLFGFTRAAPEIPAAAASAARWQSVLPVAARLLPDAELRQVAMSTSGKPAAIRFRRPGEWNRLGLSMVYISPSGEILSAVDAEAEGNGPRAYARLFPLHSAQMGSAAWKVVLLATGLGLALLSLLACEAFRRSINWRAPLFQRVEVSNQ